MNAVATTYIHTQPEFRPISSSRYYSLGNVLLRGGNDLKYLDEIQATYIRYMHNNNLELIGLRAPLFACNYQKSEDRLHLLTLHILKLKHFFFSTQGSHVYDRPWLIIHGRLPSHALISCNDFSVFCLGFPVSCWHPRPSTTPFFHSYGNCLLQHDSE